jgi:hypothetical protein
VYLRQKMTVETKFALNTLDAGRWTLDIGTTSQQK